MPIKIPELKLPFRPQSTLQVAMPIGGIGAGCLCLNGHGGLQDFSIRNRPETTARPDGHGYNDAAFGVIHIRGKNPATLLLEGPFHPEKIYDQGLQAQGYRHGGHEGLPRFANASFSSGYPFGRVVLSDPCIPLQAQVTGFNPLIPMDDKNSGIPCAILEYAFKNSSRKPVDYEFSFHLSHLAVGSQELDRGSRTRALSRGVFFFNTESPASEQFGSACLMALEGNPLVKGMWFRGGWFDSLTQLWTELSSGKFEPNPGSTELDLEGRNGGSLLFRGTLQPGEESVHPLVISWYFPNISYSHGSVECMCSRSKSPACQTHWSPYYKSLWGDAHEVARYVQRNYVSLRRRSSSFSEALLSSTVPAEVLEAVSANLAILKSPTILRQENGNLWAWEGCFTDRGCCHGSCTHVWNYAQSLPNLFPALERTLREQELLRSLSAKGHANFRAALPDGPTPHDFHAAADGQLGGILKLYRDWQISGDTPWMKSLYPHAKNSLEYCIRTWDPDRHGALFEPHHNTYDIEFWGPDGMCSSIYIAALSAAALLGRAVGAGSDEKKYRELAAKGARFLEINLFNGEYYHQKVQFQGLRDQSFLKMLSTPPAEDGQVKSLLRREGPKYQYGEGCLSDGVIGAWMAALYGVETPLKAAQIRSSLKAIYRHNFRRDLSGHANCQRPGYALGKESGLILCSWPRGGKPVLPFIYSDEVWTGIEYQVASHLIEEGFMKNGLEMVKAVRSRYDGQTRNPFNEYECGSYYARAMASYALLLSISGFRYSAVSQTLNLAPKIKKRPFQVFFSTARAWGSLTLENDRLLVSVMEGKLSLKKIVLQLGAFAQQLKVNANIKAGATSEFSFIAYTPQVGQP